MRRLAPIGLPVLAAAPGLVWLALDRFVWPWDHAWFGAHTVTLYQTLRDHPLGWPAALLQATPAKPPAVAWIGQFFVPLGSVLGSVDAALLLSVWVCQLAAVIVVWRAVEGLSGGRMRIAATGALAAAAAPIAIFLSTQYLAEASQTLAVAWFTLLMARAPAWSRARLGAHLVAATAFAMLAKTTSPLFCALPGLVALATMVRRRPLPVTDPDDRAARRWWALAVVLAAATAAWYARNLDTALQHVTTSSFGSVAELYGHRATFLRGVQEWWSIARTAFFLRPVAALLGVIALLAMARRLLGQTATATRYADLCAAAAALQILIALAVFALSPVRDARYTAPLAPLVAVLVGWATLNTRFRWAPFVVCGALGLQLVLTQGECLGLWPTRPVALRTGLDTNLSVVHRDPGPAALAAAVVDKTCGRGAFHLVGVDLMHLSGHALTYVAAKERLAGRAGDCHYDSIGFASLADARALLAAREYADWIAVDPVLHPVPPYHAFFNQTAPVVFRELRETGVLQPEPWDGPPGVFLFRFVR